MNTIPGIVTAGTGAPSRGCLVLVVGPSGAGKDSILHGARSALSGDARFLFVRREITRPADAGDEDHSPVSWNEFRARAVDGSYALAWEAHGCGYGVPGSALRGMARGQSAIANVSRGIIASAMSRFSPVRVVHVTVPERVLAQRLKGRGREDADQIARRLERAAAFHVDGDDVLTLVNDGSLERSVASFVAMLRALPAPNG
jgi:phosphonate metabolism protein PhnN/1,5-bisphosphokinase (PRPP-forming)